MRVVEFNDQHGEEFSLQKHLRPLMPRPFTNITAFSTSPITPCCFLHNPNISGVSGYGVFKREMSTVPLVSSRWNPTPEQLQALEEMYRRGTRTPSADQIQQIAAKLRKFGKIEGKNVFYWFQNHKARERQKKRRQQELLAARKMRQVETPETHVTQSGLSSKYSELEHPKKLPTPSSCSSTVLQNCVEECKKDGWTLLDEKDNELQTITAKKLSTETCSPLDLSSCMPLKQQITAQKLTSGQANENPFVPLKLSSVFNSDDLRSDVEIISGIKENQTLQLFPVRSNDIIINVGAAEDEIGTDHDDLSSVGVTKLVPSQFFEFLPTKN